MTNRIKLDTERVTKACFSLYEKLPKSGKPITQKEWTVLSCVLKYQSNINDLEVVSLGTGTKCLGSDALSLKGDVLNDSHAEIMARRGFLKYIYSEMLQETKGGSVFDFDVAIKRFRLKDNISFHFFTSHSPCGDASIAPLAPCGENQEEPAAKKPKRIKSADFRNNIGSMTGAKLITIDDDKDLMEQIVGAIRTKPGRGTRTLSVSCSDKIARWNIVGIQGALLDSLLWQPIYLDSITISGYCDEAAINRAVWQRWGTATIDKNERFSMHRPDVRIANNSLQFIHEHKVGLQPTSASIVWCSTAFTNLKPIEVSVSGKRQGITRKKINTSVARLQICKIELFRLYSIVVNEYLGISRKCTYKDEKENSLDYWQYWTLLRSNVFTDWTDKPRGLCEFFPESDAPRNKTDFL